MFKELEIMKTNIDRTLVVKNIIAKYTNMTQQELTSYRLSSLQDPTDEMLLAIMEQVAESARRSTAKFQAELHRRFELIRNSGKS